MCGAEVKVISLAPSSQCPDLFPVCCLIIVSNKFLDVISSAEGDSGEGVMALSDMCRVYVSEKPGPTDRERVGK